MKAATCTPLSETETSLTLSGTWGVAEAASLYAQLEEKIPVGTAWRLDSSDLEAADLAIWQILFRLAHNRPAFTVEGASPSLDELSNRLGLPLPAAWSAAPEDVPLQT